jgi:hypothetical protein
MAEVISGIVEGKGKLADRDYGVVEEKKGEFILPLLLM